MDIFLIGAFFKLIFVVLSRRHDTWKNDTRQNGEAAFHRSGFSLKRLFIEHP
jgi:hypothetical protein